MLGEHLGVNLKLKKDKDDDADYKNSAREACECASEKDCQWDCGEDEVAVKEDWHEGDGDESGDHLKEKLWNLVELFCILDYVQPRSRRSRLNREIP